MALGVVDGSVNEKRVWRAQEHSVQLDVDVEWEMRRSEGPAIETGADIQILVLLCREGRHNHIFSHGDEVSDVAVDHLLLRPIVQLIIGYKPR